MKTIFWLSLATITGGGLYCGVHLSHMPPWVAPLTGVAGFGFVVVIGSLCCQAGEMSEVDEHIKRGEVETFDTIEEFLETLEEERYG